MARMMAYLWEDTNSIEAPVKFGDHFVEKNVSLEDAIEETRKYIRSSFGRQKVRYDKGEYVIKAIWDVSEYAKKVGKFYKHAKVDDEMRHCIGFHVGADVHKIDADEAVRLVNAHLVKHHAPLPVVKLSTLQGMVVDEVLTAIADGKRTILAELCARFGKTIWAGAMVRELGTPLTIISSYVLTAHASFTKDLTSFEQFRNFQLVNMADDDAQEQVTESLNHGKQVIVNLSMCNGPKRNARIKWLFNRKVDRMMIVDEADYGVHRKNQVDPLIKHRQKDDVVILMTGTNPDRASSNWAPDYHVNVTYPELLIAKKKASK